MFSNEDLQYLDPKYFSIITTDAYDVTIMSRNTGHYWYLHSLKRIIIGAPRSWRCRMRQFLMPTLCRRKRMS